MNFRSFDLNKDYETIQYWADQRNLPRINKTRFSKYGLMAYDSDKDIAACFLYPFDGSEWCMFELLISNPETSPEQRDESMELLFINLCNIAKDMGYKEIFTTSHLKSVSNKLTKLGFVKNNDAVHHYIGKLV